METIHCLPNQCHDSPASLGVSRATKRRIETKNIRDGSVKSILNSWHRNDQLLISEPVVRPEIRRMTPSDDVESEIDRWYTARALEIEQNRSIELAQSSASSMQETDQMSAADHSASLNDSGNAKFAISDLEGESGSNDATFDPEIENLSAQHLHDSTAVNKTGSGKIDAKTDAQTKYDAIFSPKLPSSPVSGPESPQIGAKIEQSAQTAPESPQIGTKIGDPIDLPQSCILDWAQ